MITVVVTTFNRREIVGKSILSALRFVSAAGGSVIVVDDASADDTGALVHSQFHEKIRDRRLSYVAHQTNLGVTAAKNTGFGMAQTDWVIFLDSDDELIADAALAVQETLERSAGAPLVFFRCINERGEFVGRRFDQPQQLSLARYLAHTSYGEVLVAFNKTLVTSPPFDADLRGYEGLGCARAIKFHGPALLSTVVARRYDRSRIDRLSSLKGMLQRSILLAHGHLRYIALGGEHMSARRKWSLWAKAMTYYAAGRLYAATRSIYGQR